MARPTKTDLEKAVISLEASLNSTMPPSEKFNDCLSKIDKVIEKLKQKSKEAEYQQKLAEIEKLKKEASEFAKINNITINSEK